ncbi:MAG: DHA2 family efflux MFS transporter permease subunit, partial [Nitrospirae bacterium]
LETFPPQQHGMAMAIFGIGIMFGPIVGPLLGGWITDNWSWRWIFYINVPIGLLSLLLTALVIEDPPYMKRQRMKIDYIGLALLTTGIGSLQYVLDKGQREDWFSSNTIVVFSILALAGIGLYIIWSLFYTDKPVVDLRIFRDRTYSTGNFLMFMAFFNLFGSIVLLPILLQTAMGYTAFLAGLVLGPGGVATMLALPIAGKLVHKINPKIVLIVGIIICAWSTHLMAQFNLLTDFWGFVWPRVVLGIGMGFLFIPLTTMTVSHIPKERMQDATAMYNLLRNIGGSVGIAFITTVLARRAQFHQFRLVEHLTPFDRTYQFLRAKLDFILGVQVPSDAVIYRELLRQSGMLAFNDAFWLLSVCLFVILPLVFLM